MNKKEITLKNNSRLRKQERARPKVFVELKPTGPPPLLYRVVYGSTHSVLVCFVLMLSFLGQGIYVVHADEVAQVESSIPISTVAENSVTDSINSEIIPTSTDDQASVDDEAMNSAESQIVTDNISVVSHTEDIESEHQLEHVSTSTPSRVDETLAVSLDDTSTQTDISTTTSILDQSISTTSAQATTTTADDGVLFDEIEDGESNSSSDEVTATSSPEENQTDDIASSATSTPLGPEVPEAVSINHSDRQLIFNKNECTEIASGSFYCIPPSDTGLEDSLFSAPDEDGDLEIYLIRSGTQSQVTNNVVDDAAPFFDQNSNTLVWHRLVNDRYQIISYDIETGAEEQLTFGDQNNMEPTRQGRYTVWQKWNDNNWDIVMSDGKTDKQISQSSAHDIAPYIHGTLLAWNRYTTEGDKTIEMYDIENQTYVTVNDPEGLSVSNPRMVFVYDSLHPNGDIVTKGFDMISRQFIQLDTLPRQIPEEIPESEPTSETRALIQSKPSVKGDEAVVVDIASGPDPDLDSDSISTTTDSMTIDIKSVSSTTTIDKVIFDSSDLIIPSLTESSTSSVQTD